MTSSLDFPQEDPQGLSASTGEAFAAARTQLTARLGSFITNASDEGEMQQRILSRDVQSAIKETALTFMQRVNDAEAKLARSLQMDWKAKHAGEECGQKLHGWTGDKPIVCTQPKGTVHDHTSSDWKGLIDSGKAKYAAQECGQKLYMGDEPVGVCTVDKGTEHDYNDRSIKELIDAGKAKRYSKQAASCGCKPGDCPCGSSCDCGTSCSCPTCPGKNASKQANSIGEEFLDAANGDVVMAAVNLAAALMEGDPATFKAGYDIENALLSVKEIYGPGTAIPITPEQLEVVRMELGRKDTWQASKTADTTPMPQRDSEMRKHLLESHGVDEGWISRADESPETVHKVVHYEGYGVKDHKHSSKTAASLGQEHWQDFSPAQDELVNITDYLHDAMSEVGLRPESWAMDDSLNIKKSSIEVQGKAGKYEVIVGLMGEGVFSSKTAGELATCANCGEQIEDDDGIWYHVDSMQNVCEGLDENMAYRDQDVAEPREASKTAGGPYTKCEQCGGDTEFDSSERRYLVCTECGNMEEASDRDKYGAKKGSKTAEMRCSGCGGYDIDLADDYPKHDYQCMECGKYKAKKKSSKTAEKTPSNAAGYATEQPGDTLCNRGCGHAVESHYPSSMNSAGFACSGTTDGLPCKCNLSMATDPEDFLDPEAAGFTAAKKGSPPPKFHCMGCGQDVPLVAQATEGLCRNCVAHQGDGYEKKGSPENDVNKHCPQCGTTELSKNPYPCSQCGYDPSKGAKVGSLVKKALEMVSFSEEGTQLLSQQIQAGRVEAIPYFLAATTDWTDDIGPGVRGELQRILLAGTLATCENCGKQIEDDDGTWYHTESMQNVCQGTDETMEYRDQDVAEPKEGKVAYDRDPLGPAICRSCGKKMTKDEREHGTQCDVCNGVVASKTSTLPRAGERCDACNHTMTMHNEDGCIVCNTMGLGAGCKKKGSKTAGDYKEGAQKALTQIIGDDPLECYACGKTGTTETFGMGNNRKCPDCGSYSVHHPDAGKNWGKGGALDAAFAAVLAAEEPDFACVRCGNEFPAEEKVMRRGGPHCSICYHEAIDEDLANGKVYGGKTAAFPDGAAILDTLEPVNPKEDMETWAYFKEGNVGYVIERENGGRIFVQSSGDMGSEWAIGTRHEFFADQTGRTLAPGKVVCIVKGTGEVTGDLGTRQMKNYVFK